tara:strand:+ start:402 stop:773 length:372 start_codon:yes stop_codon:yes gene_type:complete
MASELRVNTLKDASGNNSIATSFVANGSVKMWSNVQTNQSTQDDSFNVSSVSDEGTGLCKRNLTNAFSANPFNNAGLSVEQQDNAGFSRFTSVSTSAVQTNVRNASNSLSDHMNTCLAIGDLA